MTAMSAVPMASGDDIAAMMEGLGRAARAASHVLAQATTDAKNRALKAAAEAIRAYRTELLEANKLDLAVGQERGLTKALMDRLALDPERIEAMAAGLEAIAELGDPVGRELARWTPKNGLDIARVAVPLGVIGVIYESRPNVTADAGGLCLKAGNAVILRGGSESFHSSRAIVGCLHRGLAAAGLPAATIQLVPTTDRAAVGELLAMTRWIDIIVPRGGQSLIERVQQDSRVPVIAHLIGLCHTYIDGAADPDMARDIAFNAKLRRTGICGAMETLLVDRRLDDATRRHILTPLLDAGCELRGDAAIVRLDPRIRAAKDEDWDSEYLDAILAVREVDGVEGALDHIARHGSDHTDAIVTEDAGTAERFLNAADSAIVMWNASTQFADGGEFGMGAEIGISTNRLHARGPVGVDQLTTFKYVVRGSGQTRP